eukprot:PRCOL_00004147-RA
MPKRSASKAAAGAAKGGASRPAKRARPVRAAAARGRARAAKAAAAATARGDSESDDQFEDAAIANGKGKARGKAPAPRGPKRVALRQVALSDGWETKVRIGDVVYVSMDGDVAEDEAEDLCEVCGLACDAPGKDVMLECDGCLGGYHLDCLRPKLTRVPEGDWFCPKCVGSVKVGDGEAAARAGASACADAKAAGGGRGCARTPREKFLAHQYELARIEAIWREADGTEMFSGRWFYKPEHTGPGRQPHHGRREVFLSNHVDAQEVASATGVACVLGRAAFQAMANNHAIGDATAELEMYARVNKDDVYMCEYDYDAGWQRFRRRAEGEREEWSDAEDASDDDWAGSDDDDEGDEDARAFDPRMERRRERALAGGTGKRVGRKGSGKGASAKGGAGGSRSKASARAANGRAGASARRAMGFEDAEAAGAASCVYGMGAQAIPQWVRDRKRTPLQRAREMLQLAALPASLPCREKEREAVHSFVKGIVGAGAGAGAGRCLYISGVPGTGKTATVMEVMRAARKEAKEANQAPFQLVMINGLRLPSPQHAYSSIYEALHGHYVGPSQALDLLQERFTPAAGGAWAAGSAKRGKAGGTGRGADATAAPATLLVVDELDSLVTRRQEVLYNLFEWSLAAPRKGVPRLAVIGIANTMDLPERLLPRILSRAGLRRTPFQPYVREQIEQIVRARLGACEGAFAPEAVDFASRKVAAVSGDVRRALEMCRRAAECTEERGGEMATIKDVNAAVKEMFEGAAVKSVMSLSLHERVLMAAVARETQRAGVQETEVGTVLRSHAELCKAHALPLPPAGSGALHAAVQRMGASRLLLLENGDRRHARAKVGLNVSIADLGLAARADKELPWLAKLIK